MPTVNGYETIMGVCACDVIKRADRVLPSSRNDGLHFFTAIEEFVRTSSEVLFNSYRGYCDATISKVVIEIYLTRRVDGNCL